MNGSATRSFVVERFWPGVTTPAAAADLGRLGPARTTGAIRIVGSILVPKDEVVLSLIEAPSADAIEVLFRDAGVSFDRVTETVLIGAFERGGDRDGGRR
jgi:hypothetical protein